METREVISSGNDLAAMAAVDAGCKFFGGYPITPSSEVMHTISDLLPAAGGAAIQMEDEIAGIASTAGAAMSGVRAMTATSGPGISLKAENLGLAQMAEVPLVVVNVMRGGPSTGLPTRVSQGDVRQARNPSHGDYRSITLCAGNLEECYTEVVRAFNLADRFMQPVIVLTDETIGHMHGKAILPTPEAVKRGIVPRKTFDGAAEDYRPYEVGPTEPAVLNPMFSGYRYHFTGLHHDGKGFPTEEIETCRELIQRLEQRQTESPFDLARRMKTAEEEIKQLSLFEYLVLNKQDEIDLAVSQIAAIITAEKCRVEPRDIALKDRFK